MRGWILFHRELDPALPEVPEIFRFQEAAKAMDVDLEFCILTSSSLSSARMTTGPRSIRAAP